MLHAGYVPRVLIVDDDEMLTAAMSRALRNAGIESSTAVDGRQALELVGVEPFDVLVVDINMPHMNGDELAESLSLSLPGLSCIIMTGDPKSQSLIKISELPNVISILLKPLDSFALALMIQELCRASPDLRFNYTHWRKYFDRAGFNRIQVIPRDATPMSDHTICRVSAP